MAAHDLEAITRRLYDQVWNARRYDVADELFDPEFQVDGAPGLRGGAAKVAPIRDYHASFPDLHVEIDELVVGEGRVAVRFTTTGTDTGGVKGRPATGRRVSAWGVEFLEFRDGRIVDGWVGVDWLGPFIQLGVIASPWAP